MTAVTVRLPARPLTLDDVAALADGDPDHRYEMQEGNLLVIPPADAEHAEMIMRVTDVNAVPVLHVASRVRA